MKLFSGTTVFNIFLTGVFLLGFKIFLVLFPIGFDNFLLDLILVSTGLIFMGLALYFRYVKKMGWLHYAVGPSENGKRNNGNWKAIVIGLFTLLLLIIVLKMLY